MANKLKLDTSDIYVVFVEDPDGTTWVECFKTEDETKLYIKDALCVEGNHPVIRVFWGKELKCKQCIKITLSNF